MKNSEVFLEKYKQLEDVVRSTYKLGEGDSISHYLSSQSKYKRFADDIRYCQKVRNLLCHEKKVSDSFAVEASVSMIEFIDRLIDNIKKRPKCFDIQIKFADVCWRSLNDTVKDTMTEMRNKLFTHIPVEWERE